MLDIKQELKAHIAIIKSIRKSYFTTEKDYINNIVSENIELQEKLERTIRSLERSPLTEFKLYLRRKFFKKIEIEEEDYIFMGKEEDIKKIKLPPPPKVEPSHFGDFIHDGGWTKL